MSPQWDQECAPESKVALAHVLAHLTSEKSPLLWCVNSNCVVRILVHTGEPVSQQAGRIKTVGGSTLLQVGLTSV